MKKTFCIVGFGVVGKSLINFYKHSSEKFVAFLNQAIPNLDSETPWNILLCEDKVLSKDDAALCEELNIEICTQKMWEEKKSTIDLLWISTGINPDLFSFPIDRIIKEVDIFSFFWRKPIISITGTYGKTTTTQLIKELFTLDSCENKERNKNNSALDFYNNRCTHFSGCSYRRIGLAGNIGKGLLDLIPHEPTLHAAVVELSSWQLEQSKAFAPDVGLWMNLSENHLDRHGSLEAYFNAKASFLTHQNETQKALLDGSLLHPLLRPFLEVNRQSWKSEIFFLFTKKPSNEELVYLEGQGFKAVFVDNQMVFKQDGQTIDPLFSTENIPEEGFLQNWLFALMATHFLGVEVAFFSKEMLCRAYQNVKAAVGAHRLELFLSKNNITFYNDSKATIQQATEAAIEEVLKKHQKIGVILGGLSKGADRSLLLQIVKQNPQIVYVATFGPGPIDLIGLPHFETLELLMKDFAAQKDRCHALLFSPSGSSYDLYSDYKARGDHFKLLAEQLCV